MIKRSELASAVTLLKVGFAASYHPGYTLIVNQMIKALRIFMVHGEWNPHQENALLEARKLLELANFQFTHGWRYK